MAAADPLFDLRPFTEPPRTVTAERDTILDAAERHQLAPRFAAVTYADRAAVVVTGLESGRSTTVPLYAYAAVRAALADLFSEAE